MPPCPLCGHGPDPFAADRSRAYFRCPRCALVFADPASHLDPAAEKAEYDRHRNDPADPGYRRFLSRLAGPLLEHLEPGMCGLDFGSGPGPTLSIMLEEAGMRMSVYDPYYSPDRAALGRRYDFVTCTEVVEHFTRPARDWALLRDLLRPGGLLGLMTKLVISRERFLTWHYKADPTHVGFYSPATLAWLATRLGMTMHQVGPDVILMRKP